MQTELRSSTFNSYSGNLADIAARVVDEFNAESDQSGNGFVFDFDYEPEFIKGDENLSSVEEVDEADNDDDDFEFIKTDLSSISADGVFCNGQIRPTYPVFCRTWSFGGLKDDATKPKQPVPRPSRLSLRKLMNEDKDPPKSSSTETDELEGVPAEMYCVWKPKTAEESEETALSRKCKKTSSIGSSSSNRNRWKFSKFLQRSNSDIKDTIVRLSRHTLANEKNSTKSSKISDEKGRSKAASTIY